MLLDGPVEGRVAVTDDVETATGRTEGQQVVQDAGGGADVATSLSTSTSLLPSPFLKRRPAPGTGVRCGVEPVDEPGAGSDGRGDAEGQILGQLEDLEVIEHDRLAQSTVERGQGTPEQQYGVSTEEGADPGHGRRSTTERAGQLSVGGAGLKPGGHGSQQLGPFAVVDEGEGTAREGAAAAAAAETGNVDTAGGRVGAVFSEAETAGPGVVRAVVSGAEPGAEILQSINGCARPVHAVWSFKNSAERTVAPKTYESTTWQLEWVTGRPPTDTAWTRQSASGRNSLGTTMNFF